MYPFIHWIEIYHEDYYISPSSICGPRYKWIQKNTQGKIVQLSLCHLEIYLFYKVKYHWKHTSVKLIFSPENIFPRALSIPLAFACGKKNYTLVTFSILKKLLMFSSKPILSRKEWKPDIFIAILLTYQIHKKFHGLLCDNIFGIVDQQGTILSVKLHAEIAQRKSDKIEKTSENRFRFVCKHHRLKLYQSHSCERGQGAWVGFQFCPFICTQAH